MIVRRASRQLQLEKRKLPEWANTLIAIRNASGTFAAENLFGHAEKP
jgi:hypothetical protein